MARRAASNAEIRALPGGSRILLARERARALLRFLSPEQTGPEGPADGWDGITRRGRPEDLLLSEHLHDREEFLRRAVDGEQLYLARRAFESEGRSGIMCWDLTAAALGSARRNALGLALSLSERHLEERGSFRLLLGAGPSFTLRTAGEIESALAVPPAPSRATLTSWRSRILEATIGEPTTSVIHWLALRHHDLARGEELLELLGAGAPAAPGAAFVVEPHRFELHRAVPGRRGVTWTAVVEAKVVPGSREPGAATSALAQRLER